MNFDMPSCGGCRTCELACSFHHKKEFSPDAFSSIKILEKEDKKEFYVHIVEETNEFGIACDGCPDLDLPLCMQYCRKQEDLQKIIEEYTRKVLIP